MEKVSFGMPAKKKLASPVQIQTGVVASGDLEVLFMSDNSDELKVSVLSTADNSAKRWKALLERISQATEFPGGQMILHDFGATPGVARLRIEQSLEEIQA